MFFSTSKIENRCQIRNRGRAISNNIHISKGVAVTQIKLRSPITHVDLRVRVNRPQQRYALQSALIAEDYLIIYLKASFIVWRAVMNLVREQIERRQVV